MIAEFYEGTKKPKVPLSERLSNYPEREGRVPLLLIDEGVYTGPAACKSVHTLFDVDVAETGGATEVEQ